ncbi:uncharacterized protein B0H64DRAFT_461081 [Chaetomium fimeti]|uniref:Vacuolar ATPase assembly protein VMA22 n=1 Tax=Chaetomium fimeti TaxID=1854472 RepID=A0AAE0LSF7_9PEZI|nr:hypothetical protein B0H64DRAFT_461081 [Chaetomium fimeti]
MPNTNPNPHPAPPPNSTSNPNPHPTSSSSSPPTKPATTDTNRETSTIDALLTGYLSLLDEYTALRHTLHALQARMYHDLARANFAAERGVRRYGRDYYDGRMQAGRRVRVCDGGGGLAGGDVDVKGAEGDREEEGVGGGGEREGEDGKKGEEGDDPREREGVVFRVAVYPPPGRGAGGKGEDEGPGTEAPTTEAADGNGNGDREEKKPGKEGPAGGGEGEKQSVNPIDPLRWFGILTPLPLRQAQGHAIKAVEEIIPQLATLSAAMAAVELEVRRARKKRAKAEKAEEKKLVALEEKMGEVDVNE